MGILKALVKTVVEIPCSVIKDSFTLGGVLIDEESSTKTTYEEILKELD